MRAHKYEIYQRQSDDHRPGHFALLIDGIDAEITCDPAQFTARSIRQLLAEGKPHDPVEVGKLNDQLATRAIETKIDKLRRGRIVGGPRVEGITAAELEIRYGDERQAVEAYLHRGRLRGLDKADRKKRRERRRELRDCETEWRERRLQLIARREEELKGWEAELAAGNPKAQKHVINLRNEIRALAAPVLNATHGFQYAFGQYWSAAVNLSSDDIRIWPLMTNTTVDTERDAIETFGDFSTVDEFDGANYTSGGLALDSQAINIDDANDRAEFDAADVTVSSLGAGTRDIQGVCVGKFDANTAGSMPLHWLEFSVNKKPDGSDFTFQFNVEGILQLS